MVSVDVKSLFTSIPSEYTTDIIIKRFFEDHEITKYSQNSYPNWLHRHRFTFKTCDSKYIYG